MPVSHNQSIMDRSTRAVKVEPAELNPTGGTHGNEESHRPGDGRGLMPCGELAFEAEFW